MLRASALKSGAGSGAARVPRREVTGYAASTVGATTCIISLVEFWWPLKR